MSKRLYSHKRVRYWYAYTVDEICILFKDVGLHPQTVRKWTKSGLKTIDKGKPALIYGNELINYFKKNNRANKCSTAFDEFFCMSCQDGRPIYQSNVFVSQKTQFLKVQGRCRYCKTDIYKNYKMDDLSKLKKKFKLVDVSQLYDDASTSGKTHIQPQEMLHENESLQLDLFE